MIVRYKKMHPDAVEPEYAKAHDGAMDLTAIDDGKWDLDDTYISYDTGIAFEIPEGYVGLLFPRSSVSVYDISLANSVGVLDSGYRDSVSFRFRPQPTPARALRRYKKGDRIGQIIILPRPTVTLIEADELSSSQRGTSGYGSSGA